MSQLGRVKVNTYKGTRYQNKNGTIYEVYHIEPGLRYVGQEPLTETIIYMYVYRRPWLTFNGDPFLVSIPEKDLKTFFVLHTLVPDPYPDPKK